MADHDFPSAAARHLEDGERLCSAGRHDNAQHLLGFAVECALKTIVERAGLNPVPYGHKLMDLHGKGLDLAVALAPVLGRCRIPPEDVQFFRDRWSEQHRYRTTGKVTKKVAEDLLEAARRVYCATIVPMVLDGYLNELPR